MVHGEAGVGKTALLDYLNGQASGCRVLRVAGSQPDTELAFAGLHQLCAPMLDHLESLAEPQRDALLTAFGMRTGSPDQFLIGLAVLGLLSEAAGRQPVVCLIDDYQWLDPASARILGFVARRLADSVALVFAVRVPGAELAGLPQLPVTGLREADARALLESAAGRNAGLAGQGADHRRGTREPAGPARTVAGPDAGAARGRLLAAGGDTADRPDRGKLPATA